MAVELKADLLLVYERRGRTIAVRLGFAHIGLLGILVESKQQGAVDAS